MNAGRRFLILWGLLLVGMFLASLNLASAKEMRQAWPPLPGRPNFPPLAQDIQPERKQPMLPQSAAAEDYAGWTSIVFSNLVGDMAIAVYGDYKTKALTSEELIFDMQPRFDRGAQRIVFSSNRGGEGDFDIYLMNSDGSAIRRIVDSAGDDFLPDWSPDGQTVLFTSTRDGQMEIYRAGADGRGLKNLSSHPADDAAPSWSPDGTQIAFVSARDGGSDIYTIKADGTAVRRLTACKSCNNPMWSPDGEFIAYDAQLDGDPWHELAIMNADGSGQRLLQNPPGDRTVFASGWSPDGLYATYTQMELIRKEDGNWYHRTSDLRAVGLESGATSFEVSLHHYYAADFNWQTTDITPPQATMQRVLPYSRYKPLDVAWRGQDNRDGAGLRSFDLQLNEDSAGWQDVRFDTPAMTARMEVPAGTQVALRVRARDRAFNVYPWAAAQPVYTTSFRNIIQGTAIDNRGAPLAELPLALEPAALQPLVTGHAGVYMGRTWHEGAHVLSIAAEGYAATPPTSLPANEDVTGRLFYLRPQQDIVNNGTFEAAQLPAGWQVSGDLPVSMVTTVPASGKNAVQLGNPPGAPNQRTSWREAPGILFTGSSTVDNVGHVHTIWSEFAYERNETTWFHSQTSDGQIWSEPQEFGRAQGYYEQALITADATGALQIVIRGEKELFYVRREADGRWSRWQTIRKLGGAANRWVLDDLAAGQDGGLHLLVNTFYPYHSAKPQPYEGDGVEYMYRRADGTWDAPFVLDYGIIPKAAQMALGPDGTLHFTWKVELSEASSGSIRYQRRLPDGLWNVPEEVTDIKPGYNDRIWDLLVDARSTIHLFLDRSPAPLQHTSRALFEDWRPLTAVVPGVDNVYLFSNAAADSVGGLHMQLARPTASGVQQIVLQWAEESGWKETRRWLNQSAQTNSLLIDNADNAHMLAMRVVENEESRPRLLYSRTAASGESGAAFVAQQVTIPANMANPTLSFMGRGTGDYEAGGSGLEVSVKPQAGAEEVLWNSRLTANWHLYWLDMSAWSGQQVTLSFRLTQSAADPAQTAFVDDVALGPALPETWVTAQIAPGAGLQSEIVEMAIQVGNQGAVDGRAPKLTVELHPTLSLVEATLPPQKDGQKLTWALDTLAAGQTLPPITLKLRLKKSEKPGALLVSTVKLLVADEAHTVNNRAAARMTYGILSYLPVNQAGP